MEWWVAHTGSLNVLEKNKKNQLPLPRFKKNWIVYLVFVLHEFLDNMFLDIDSNTGRLKPKSSTYSHYAISLSRGVLLNTAYDETSQILKWRHLLSPTYIDRQISIVRIAAIRNRY